MFQRISDLKLGYFQGLSVGDFLRYRGYVLQNSGYVLRYSLRKEQLKFVETSAKLQLRKLKFVETSSKL